MSQNRNLVVFQEVRFLPNTGVDINFLWGKVFQQTHFALIEHLDKDGISEIGVSFPQYSYDNRKLGEKLRFFSANEEKLNALNFNLRMSNFRGYIEISKVLPIPENVHGFSSFRREHVKTSLVRMARRKSRREKISLENAIDQLSGFNERSSSAPYINLQSKSTRNSFKLFILKEEVPISIYQGFNSYGLSASTTSTIPQF